jgi:hypothetical protein
MKVNLVGIEPREDRQAVVQALILTKCRLVASAQFSVVLRPLEASNLRLGAALMAAEGLSA